MDDYNSKQIQLQYQGYLNTSRLWKKGSIFGLKQIELPEHNISRFNEIIPKNLRLGKRVERFVHAELIQHQNIEILLENAQVQNQKITIGEIDCILKLDQKPIHLEIVFKFYLYDSNVGATEIDHWIGPNRNDSLLKKLNKLKNKQLPLIYNEHTNAILKQIDLKSDEIVQRILFKAQLFVPYKTIVNFECLNEDCLTGFYIKNSELSQFSHCKFHIPIKVDWLIELKTRVSWIDFQQFNLEINPIIFEKRAQLCWVKFPNGNLQKFFIVWW